MNYNHFLRSPAKKVWKRISTIRRSGVVVPLFSVYSEDSIGIGEIPDLKLVVDWCVQAGMSVIQLLPMNELGYGASPYNSLSTFALEPSYLRIQSLNGVDQEKFERKVNSLKSLFSDKILKVDYSIRNAKLEFLKIVYSHSNFRRNAAFNSFVYKNKYWLPDYAAYKVLKDINNLKSWEEWKSNHRSYSRKTAGRILKKYRKQINFHYWIQWQLYEQMKDAKEYAASRNVLIMGDMPFLVSRDSADIWSHRKYFNLNVSAGAPPDMYFAFGQKWGMPVYNWKEISSDGFRYINERIKYASNFYDMFRIDHFVGLFRIWTTPFDSEGLNNKTAAGKFDPREKSKWESHGKKIIKAMLKASEMLPCAEDLGTVPACSYKTLKEFKIPGTDFQRFNKKPRSNYEFVNPRDYRKNSTVVISTHDTSFFPGWWSYEAGTIDEELFDYLCRKNNIESNEFGKIKSSLFETVSFGKGRLYWRNDARNIHKILKHLKFKTRDVKKILKMHDESYGEKEKFMAYLGLRNKKPPVSSPAFQYRCIERAGSSASIFSIQLIHEYMFMNYTLFRKMNKPGFRINFPGSSGNESWKLRLPLSLESILNSVYGKDVTKKVRRINKKTMRR